MDWSCKTVIRKQFVTRKICIKRARWSSLGAVDTNMRIRGLVPPISPATADFPSNGADRSVVDVLICADHEVLRAGLERVVRSAPDLHVVAHATGYTRVEQLCRLSAPDVALVSLNLPSSLDLVRLLAGRGVAVVVLAPDRTEADVVAALCAGARSYLTTGVVTEQLLGTVRTVASGDITLEPQAARLLVLRLLGPGPEAADPVAADDVTATLTERQTAIAELVAEGLSNSEIAARLFLSQATVKGHLTVILRQLGLRDRTQLAIVMHRDANGRATDAADDSALEAEVTRLARSRDDISGRR